MSNWATLNWIPETISIISSKTNLNRLQVYVDESFWVFDRFNSSAPSPSSKCPFSNVCINAKLCFSLNWKILVDDVEGSRIFVQSFRARLWELTDRLLRKRAREFIATLRLKGEAFYDRYFYLASYSRFNLFLPEFIDPHSKRIALSNYANLWNWWLDISGNLFACQILILPYVIVDLLMLPALPEILM